MLISFFKKGTHQSREIALEANGNLTKKVIDVVQVHYVGQLVHIRVQNTGSDYDMKPIDDLYYLDDQVGRVIRGQNNGDQPFKMKIEKNLWMN